MQAARAYSVFTPADGSKTIRLDQPLIDAIDGSFVDDLDHATMSTALRAALLAIGIEFSPSARIIVIAPTSSWNIEDGQTQAHASRNLLGNIDIYRDRVMELIGLPVPVAFDPGIAQYRVRDRDGFEGFLCATQTQLAIVSATASYPACSDIVQLDGIQISGTTTAISVSPPVSNWYDPLTVSVCGNVVSASHGESLPMDDVLGSGDGSAGNPIIRFAPATAHNLSWQQTDPVSYASSRFACAATCRTNRRPLPTHFFGVSRRATSARTWCGARPTR